MKILVTGFDPFGGEKVNPAWEAVSRLPEQMGEHQLIRMMVPTSFERAPQMILEKAALCRPDYVISIGQAAGRTAITPERIAINMMSASIADNDGDMPQEQKIESDGPDGYFSLLPVLKMVHAIEAAGLPGKISNTAGTFVCNRVMYSLLHACHTCFPGMKSGFIHVPCIPEQRVAHPEWFALPVEEITKGLAAAITAIE